MIISRSIPLIGVEGRTLEGVAYHYVKPSLVTDDGGETHYYEQLLNDADTKTIRDRAEGTFPLLIWHSRTSNAGHFPTQSIGDVTFRPTEEACEFTAVLSRSKLADEMLELVQDETARDTSVSYKPLRDIEGVWEGRPLVSRAEIALRELSLCPTGTAQHDGAKVLVMRATDALPNRSDITARLRLLDL